MDSGGAGHFARTEHTSLAASILSLRRSASVPVTLVPPRPEAAFFFAIAPDIGAFGVTRT